jgi:NAD+ diphosphatase
MSHTSLLKQWLIFRGQDLLVNSAILNFPVLAHLQQWNMEIDEQHILGIFDGYTTIVVRVPDNTLAPKNHLFLDLRTLLSALAPQQFALAGKAAQILEWAKNHRFCGCCGTATTPHPHGERALVCPHCQFVHYPRINPCVIVTIKKDDTILLARSSRFNRPIYSLLAGFVEVGETLEQAVSREVLEEVGITLRNIRYWGSQAWPFPSNLMLGFSAEWASGDLVLQEDEILDAQFFKYNALPKIPHSGTISAQMIHATVTELAQQYR